MQGTTGKKVPGQRNGIDLYCDYGTNGRYGIPVVADGFISSVAALTAIRIEPLVQDYVIASHVSKEPAGAMLLEAIGKSPSLTCDMCLGEERER